MKIPLLVILGPTAVGKTNLSIKIAQRLQGEIISADSVQIYKHLDIGSAKPSKQERERVKHHLLDIIEPDQDFTVASYKNLANQVIKDIYQKNKLPILCGGTGLYINSVIYDYVFQEQGKDEKFRKELQDRALIEGSFQLHKELALVDPEAAKRIHANDLRRIVRALEVYLLTGKPITEQIQLTKERDSLYNSIIIGLTRTREELYERINCRVDLMLAAGLISEVEKILEKGFSPDLKSLQSLGYAQVIKYLKNEYTYQEAREILKRDTRRFAKRQLTWFRRDNKINWVDISGCTGEEDAILELICSLTAGKLN